MNPRCFTPVLAALLLAACGKGPGTPAATPVTLSAEQQKLYDNSCKLCHNDPSSGAPQVGDAAAWGKRRAQGKDVLLAHVTNGYQRMPPLGLCMACTEEQFLALTEYLSGGKLP